MLSNSVTARSFLYGIGLISKRFGVMLFICLICDKEIVRCMVTEGKQEYHIANQSRYKAFNNKIALFFRPNAEISKRFAGGCIRKHNYNEACNDGNS
jgi:hypothetical protein